MNKIVLSALGDINDSNVGVILHIGEQRELIAIVQDEAGEWRLLSECSPEELREFIQKWRGYAKELNVNFEVDGFTGRLPKIQEANQ